MRQADGTTFLHEYTIKDHLGNARVTYSDANNDGVIAVADIKQINHFYPFGLNMEGNWNGAAGSNKYQYNQKEWNDDFGLGMNDYGARFYDPAIARWTAVDPLSEIYRRWSPYNYGMNNPIRFNDPTGMASEAANTGMMGSNQSTNFDRFTTENERKIYGYAQSDVASSKSGDEINNDSDTDPYEGWEDLTKDKLREYAEGQANHCNPCDENQLGAFFEDVFSENVRSLDGFRKAELTDLSEDGGIRNTRPDFMANASYNVGMKSKKIPGGVWYELKAMNGNLYRSSDLGGIFGIGQIEGHITNLAAKFAALRVATNGAFMPALYVITTSDVKTSPVLKLIALGQGVNFYQIHAFYNIDKNGKWHFKFLPPRPLP